MRTPSFLRTLLVVIIASIPLQAQAAEDVSELVKRLKPAVVTILAYASADSPLPASQGTGFFVAADRLVTNWHVVQDAAKLEFRDSSGIAHAVTGLVGRDAKADLAVLVPNESYKPATTLQVARSEPEIGARIYALGSPLGLEYTLSEGLVSSKREFDGQKVLQITAAISSGSSGSPVFGQDGLVVGVATFKFTGGESLNFAIPVASLSGLMEGEVQPVSDATKAGPAARPGTDQDLAEQLYTLFAARYLAAMKEQNTNRPLMKFGNKAGSVGHLNVDVRVFQILSDDSALLQAVDDWGKELLLFQVSGVDLSNYRDGELTAFEDHLVLAQFTTFQYTTVMGASRTVYAVQALDRQALCRALLQQNESMFERRDQLATEMARLQAEGWELANRLHEVKSAGSKIERASELIRDIKMYWRVMEGRPDIQEKVRVMQAELDALGIDESMIGGRDQAMHMLTEQIRKNHDEVQRLEWRIQDAERALPAILKDYYKSRS